MARLNNQTHEEKRIILNIYLSDYYRKVFKSIVL